MEKRDDSHLLDEYLQSLDGMQQAETRPFFFSSLKSRLQADTHAQSGFIFRPAFIICTLLFLLMVNFWMITTQRNSGTQKDESVSSLYSFSETYNFNVSSY